MTNHINHASVRTILVIGFLLFASALLHAGAWTAEKGQVYLKLAANEFKSSANFDIHGDRFDPFEGFDDRYSKFRDRNYSVYLEYGLFDRLTLVGSLTYKEIRQTTKLPNLKVGASNSGFADLDLGLRYRLSQGPDVLSLALLTKLPYLYEDDDDFFQLGNGQEDIEIRLLYGRSLPKGFYTGLEAGYRFRTQEPSDEYRYLGELGYAYGRFYTHAKIEGVRSVDEFEEVPNFGNPLLNPRYDLTTLRLNVGYKLTSHWHLEYGYANTIAGKNTADGSNNQLAVVLNF